MLNEQGLGTRRYKKGDLSVHTAYWAIQAGLLTPLTFAPVSLKSLGCFYFRCVLSSQWKAVKVNLGIFTLPTLKAFLEARSHNVSGNEQ